MSSEKFPLPPCLLCSPSLALERSLFRNTSVLSDFGSMDRSLSGTQKSTRADIIAVSICTLCWSSFRVWCRTSSMLEIALRLLSNSSVRLRIVVGRKKPMWRFLIVRVARNTTSRQARRLPMCVWPATCAALAARVSWHVSLNEKNESTLKSILNGFPQEFHPFADISSGLL